MNSRNSTPGFPATRHLIAGLAFFVCCLAPDPVWAADDAIEARARETVRKASDFYRGLGSLSVSLGLSIKVEMQGMKTEMSSDYDLSMQRPNRLAMVSKGTGFGAMMGGTIVSDGTNAYTHITMLGKYTVADAPASIGELLGDSAMLMMQGNPALGVVASLLSDDPYESLLEGVKTGRHAGVETVNGVECEHLKFQQAGLDWDLWVATGDQPKVVRIVPDMGKALSEIADAEEMPDQLKQLQDMKMEFVVDFTGWAFNPELPADRFAFTPPEGAELVESLFEGLAGGGEDYPLLGRPAPNLTLDLHGGGRLELAALKGKKVVVLDFWASWCGPCVKGMPIVAGVAEDFKDRDVVLYAVNLREDKETIEGFLKEHRLTLNVALDPDGSSGDAYSVEGIPQTVLIGKDGRVEAVHVGLLPDLKKKLTGELESLVKGEKLVAE